MDQATERDFFKRELDGKTQVAAALQRDLDWARVQLRERDGRLVELDGAAAEAERLRGENASLQMRIFALSMAAEGTTETNEKPAPPGAIESIDHLEEKMRRAYSKIDAELRDFAEKVARNEEQLRELRAARVRQGCSDPADSLKRLLAEKIGELVETRHDHAESLEAELQRTELDTARATCAKLTAEKDALQQSLDATVADLKQTKQELEGHPDFRADSLKRLVAEKICELVVTRHEHARQRTEIDTTHATCAKLTAEKDMLQQSLNATVADLNHTKQELALSMRMFKEDCELLELENCSLKESNAIFEASLERISGQHARLMGHNK